MPPRVNVRGRGDRGGRPRTRDVDMAGAIEMLRRIEERLQAVEAAQAPPREDSTFDKESITEASTSNRGQLEEYKEDRLLKALSKIGKQVSLDVPPYDGSLNSEVLLDWIRRMDAYFEVAKTVEEMKVKIAVTKLSGLAATWWEHVQHERKKKGKEKIRSWEKMVSKLKSKFLPPNYKRDLYQQLQNLKQNEKSIKEYTEEFHKLTIHTEVTEDKEEHIARYIGGLRTAIKDKMAMINPSLVEEAYQYAIKAEEKLQRRGTTRFHQGYTQSRGRGGKIQSQAQRTNPARNLNQQNASRVRQDQQITFRGCGRGGRFVPHFRPTGKPTNSFRGACFKCGEYGHRLVECPKAAADSLHTLAPTKAPVEDVASSSRPIAE